MQVIIINSPLFRDRNDKYDEDSLPPLGLGYIATSLKKNGVKVELIDAIYQKIPLHELVKTLENSKPKFIASNIFTTNYDLVKDLVEAISFKTHFIIGGLSTKQLYKDIINWKTKNHIDIVTGDGELITVDIVKNQVRETPFIEENNRRVFQINGESIYAISNISNIPLDRTFFLNEPVEHPLGFIEGNIVTSRGCIYNCTFCAAARSLNKEYPVRERTFESITQELKEIKDNYPGVTSIRVLDDLFLKTKHSVQKAIDIFSGFDFQWRSMAHVMTFNKVDLGIMTLLKESGCYELFIGIESGSPRILKSINKTKDIDKIVFNLTKVLKVGINIKGYFIYGFPNEDEEDMLMTFQLARKLKRITQQYSSNFRTSVFQYRPYHGTQIYYDLEAQGHNLEFENMQPNHDLSDLVGRSQFNFHTGNCSNVETKVLYDYIYRTNYLNDGNIFAGLKSKNRA